VHDDDPTRRLLDLVRELKSQSRTSLGEEADHAEESRIDDAIRSQMGESSQLPRSQHDPDIAELITLSS